jgi:hypothetical protein
MNGPDRLQALFDALAQPATPSELADEAQTVDVVARAISVSKGSTMQIPSNSRRLRVASFLAAGIIGFGGVAAAGPAVFDSVTGADDATSVNLVAPSTVPEVSLRETTVPTTKPEATTTTDPEATTTTEPEATTSAVAAATGGVSDDEPSADGEASVTELVDDPDTDFDETECAPGNHGKTVSSVAQATPNGPGKGAIVSEAAQSSCGKGEKSDKEGDDDDGDETSDDDGDETSDGDDGDDSDDDSDDGGKKVKEKGSARDDSSADRQSNGNGNGNGKGKGKGKGKNG